MPCWLAASMCPVGGRDLCNMLPELPALRLLGCSFLQASPFTPVTTLPSPPPSASMHSHTEAVRRPFATHPYTTQPHTDSKVRMENLLAVMMRLRAARNLDNRHAAAIDAAYFATRPPTKAGARRRRRPPMQVGAKLYCGRRWQLALGQRACRQRGRPPRSGCLRSCCHHPVVSLSTCAVPCPRTTCAAAANPPQPLAADAPPYCPPPHPPSGTHTPHTHTKPQEYTRHLIFDVLSDGTIVDVLRRLMRLPWDRECERYVLKCLLKVGWAALRV